MSQSSERSKPALGKRLRLPLLICGGLYLAACVGCASLQRRLIFYPPVFTPQQVDDFARAARLERWRNPAGLAVGMKRLSPVQPAAGRVLIVYGNGSYSTACARYADAIQKAAALDVFILEYPGYADRPGAPSQDSLFRAADEGLRLLGTNGPLYLAGESLGTGVAAYLAGTYPDKVAGVVLFAPYNRLADVGQYHVPVLPVHWLLVDRFPSEDYLRQYHGPVFVFVGDKDRVVPEKFGRRLYDGYAGPKRIREIPGADHWTVTLRTEEDWKEIVDFWRGKSR
jgi:pimeloyl-ACP methyl ester carboxylesterase